MGKQAVIINNNSITNSVTKDPKKAICEFIWNGFDANAKIVSINYKSTQLGAIETLSIEDDGEGISRSSLSFTFGTYQDSIKKRSFQWSSQVKGHKGKGRYSFNCFATRATWKTIYKDGDKLLCHSLHIDANDNQHFNDETDQKRTVVHGKHTGTKVSFDNVNLSEEFFKSKDFLDYLRKEFAVFLELNKESDKKILINGEELRYEELIADRDCMVFGICDKNNQTYNFNVTFIRWSLKLKEKYYIYFLDDEKVEKYEKTSSFNNKDTEFHHSLYVVSSYFNQFTNLRDPEQEKDISGNVTIKDHVFIELNKKIKSWLTLKQKEFIHDVAGEELWKKYEKNGIVKTPKSSYEKPLYNDLKATIKSIYAAQPKIFINLKDDAAKTLIGMISLLLQSDKREDVIVILDSVVKLSEEERKNLVGILKVTTLSHITVTIQMLKNRAQIVNALKALIFDKDLETKEVPDLQNMVSNAFWLFGEEYNIVTEAEPDFEGALMNYLNQLSASTKGVSKSIENKPKIKDPDKNKEMDLFAFRQNVECNRIENIVVELKRPTVKLGEIEVSQVKTYMKTIASEPRFNAPNCIWRFILVGNEFSSNGYIEGELENSQSWGKPDLIFKSNKRDGVKYEIYVKKWSSIFADYRMRNDFLLKRLKFKQEMIAVKYHTKDDLHEIVKDKSKNV